MNTNEEIDAWLKTRNADPIWSQKTQNGFVVEYWLTHGEMFVVLRHPTSEAELFINKDVTSLGYSCPECGIPVCNHTVAREQKFGDMHRRNVSIVLGIPITDVTSEQRAIAKQVCFGAGTEAECLEQLKMYLRIGNILRKKEDQQ